MKLLILFGLVLILAVIMSTTNQGFTPAPAPSRAERLAQTDSQTYDAAIWVCEEWTKKNSKVSVAKITDGFTRKDQHKKDRVFNVGVRYIGKELPVVMRADCSVHWDGDNYVIAKAASYVEGR